MSKDKTVGTWWVKHLDGSWSIPYSIGQDTPTPYANFEDAYRYTTKDEDLNISENPDDYIVSDTPLDDILELETLTIKLPKDVTEKLDKLSKILGMNKASLIWQILVTRLEGLVDE